MRIQAGQSPSYINGIRTGEAYHINQRNEGIDLGGVSGALMHTQNMQMQTFVTQPCLTPWDTQQKRIFTPESVAPTMAGADGGGGRNPVGLLFSAAFHAGAGPGAGGIGYTEEGAPTLTAGGGGTNLAPAVLCLNDQGGDRLDADVEVTGTLRAQEHGHQPLVLFENHGIDSRYTGPHPVAPTMSARYGTGGNNVPLIGHVEPVYCITGNAIDRKPQNGGNGIGYQADIAYTLTATDHHAVFNRQRVDAFREEPLASTESARQGKDATDLILQEQDAETRVRLIRRLMPVECERLQGFPDDWTDIPGASDSARYKALGNSVAIPCVEYVLRGIAAVLTAAG